MDLPCWTLTDDSFPGKGFWETVLDWLDDEIVIDDWRPGWDT